MHCKVKGRNFSFQGERKIPFPLETNVAYTCLIGYVKSLILTTTVFEEHFVEFLWLNKENITIKNSSAKISKNCVRSVCHERVDRTENSKCSKRMEQCWIQIFFPRERRRGGLNLRRFGCFSTSVMTPWIHLWREGQFLIPYVFIIYHDKMFLLLFFYVFYRCAEVKISNFCSNIPIIIIENWCGL